MSLRGFALLVLLALVVAPTVRAEEGARPEDDAEALLQRAATLTQAVADHRKSRDMVALEADLREAVELYAATPGETEDRTLKKLKSATVKLVGTLLKVRDQALRSACFDALGTMGDPSGARYVKPYLKPVSGSGQSPLLEPALEAAGEIACDRLVRPLLTIVQKSKVARAKVLAMRALANFGHCKRHRGKIALEIVQHVKRYRPGRRRSKENQVDPSKGPIGGGGGGSSGQWSTLSATLPYVLNKLTGTELNDPEAWIDLVEENRRNLEVLFQDEN